MTASLFVRLGLTLFVVLSPAHVRTSAPTYVDATPIDHASALVAAPSVLIGAGASMPVTEHVISWAPTAPVALETREMPDAVAVVRTVTNTNDSGVGSLRAALIASADGDTIQFSGLAANAVITLTTGQLTVTKAITINGSTGTNLAVDGNAASRGFLVTAALKVISLTIRNGNVTGSGGGLYASGDLTLMDVNFRSNVASGTGGGMYAFGAVSMQGGSAISNTSRLDGGGVFIYGSANVTRTAFTSNTATTGDGGGAYINGSANVTSSAFTNNSGGKGGGVLFGGSANVTSSTFSRNASSNHGGGAYFFALANVTSSTFTSNTAPSNSGGGAFFNGSSNVTGSAFAGNNANGYGGGARFGVTANVTSSTFASNTAEYGGGAAFAAAVNVTGSTFSRNAATYGGGAQFASSANVTGSTFATNTADYGGGAYLNGVTSVTGGAFTSNTAFEAGGAYFGNSATLNGSTFIHNSASTTNGGGAAFHGATSVAGSAFFRNTANNDGGGAYFYGTANVTGSTFASNTTSLFNGGGAYFYGTTNVTGSAFHSNTALLSGGGAYFVGTANVTGSAFERNTAILSGGGARFDGTANVTGSMFSGNTAMLGGGAMLEAVANVTGSVFMSNTATAGGFAGGMYFAGNSPKRVVNTLVARNSAVDPRGTAIYVSNAGPLSLIHTTIAEPIASTAGAILVLTGTLRMTNTLISGHAVGIERGGGTVSEDYILFDAIASPYSGTVSSGGHSITGTAGFVNAAVNNFHLGPGSRAIDAGVNAGIAFDFEGAPRPQGNAPDIGYDESPHHPCLATPDDGTTVYGSSDAAAVREALMAASLGATVKVAGYCAGVALQGGGFQVALITRTLTLAGGYTRTNWTSAFPITQPATLDAVGGGRVIFAGVAATLLGLLAVNGSITGTGGGVYAAQPITLSQMTVANNRALGTGAAGFGGGAYFNATANITGSTFASNTALLSGGGALFAGPANVTGSVFAGNTASTNNGGGAYFNGSTSVTGSRFDGNTANRGGGAVMAAASNVTGSVFMSNSATAGGFAGGMYFEGNSSKNVVNTLFARNTAVDTRGTAIYVANGGPLNLIHNTIVAPIASSAGAIHVVTGTLRMTNTLISGHAVGIAQGVGSVSEDYTLFDAVTTPYSGTIATGGHSITGTAAFVNAGADDYRLGPGSAAINAGVNAGITIDFEGTLRPLGGSFDIGFDEALSPRAFAPLVIR